MSFKKRKTFIQLVIGCARSQLWHEDYFVVVHGLSNCGTWSQQLYIACEDFSDQGSSSCPLHCKAESKPLDTRKSLVQCLTCLCHPHTSQILDVQCMNIINTVRKELLTLDILIPVNVQWMAHYLLRVSLLRRKGKCLNTLQVDFWEEPITCNHIHNLTKQVDFSLKLIHANPLLSNIKITYSYIQIIYILDFTIINFILFSF